MSLGFQALGFVWIPVEVEILKWDQLSKPGKVNESVTT